MPRDSNSDVDLYVSNIHPNVTKLNYTWKATSVGPVTLYIVPEDSYYKEGWYYIGVYGYKKDINTFTLTVALTDPGNLLWDCSSYNSA